MMLSEGVLEKFSNLRSGFKKKSNSLLFICLGRWMESLQDTTTCVTIRCWVDKVSLKLVYI